MTKAKDPFKHAEKGKVGILGVFTLELRDKDGKLKKRETFKNLIVNEGLDWIKDFCFNPGTTKAAMSHMAVGTGATAPDPTDTTLQTELLRKAFDNYTPGTVGVFIVDVTFAAGEATGILNEAGIFNAATAGEMWDRVVFPSPYDKGATDVLKFNAAFTFSKAS